MAAARRERTSTSATACSSTWPASAIPRTRRCFGISSPANARKRRRQGRRSWTSWWNTPSTITKDESQALEDLARTLRSLPRDAAAETIQSEVYEVGKRHPFADLKSWFRALYEILLGQSQGPRMGTFIALYGIDETIDLIRRAVAGEDLGA